MCKATTYFIKVADILKYILEFAKSPISISEFKAQSTYLCMDFSTTNFLV